MIFQKVRDSADFARVSAEVKQLREDESQLRQENLQLKVSLKTVFIKKLHRKFHFRPNFNK